MRRVWAAVIAVAVILCPILAVELARPREFLTGTNGAGSEGPVVHVQPRQRLCLDHLEVPDGTGRLRLFVAAAAATTVTTDVIAAGHVERRQLPIKVSRAPLAFDVPAQRVRGVSALCISPAGQIDVAGRNGLENGQTAPLLDSKPIDASVALSYVPPSGKRTSLLAQMPSMFSRAARFRPGIVSPWTYAVLLFALAPALFCFALFLFVRSVMDRPVRRTALAVGVIGFLAAASWSLIVPVFDAPDELEHIAYAQAIAERGRAPDIGPSHRRAYSSEAQVAYEGARVSGYYGQRLGRPPWTAQDEGRWARRQARERPRPDDGGGWITVADYTPLYYASLAPAYVATDGDSIWSRFTALRLTTALFGGLTAALAVMIVGELFPRPLWPAVAAGLFVAFQPMFAFISGVVNNDASVSAAAALAIFLVVRALRRGLTVRLALAIGATLVVLPMLKGSGLFLLPALGIGLASAAFRTRRRAGAVGRPLTALAASLAICTAASIAFSAAVGHSADPTRPGWNTSKGTTYPTLPGAAVKPSGALHHPIQFGEYIWQVFLPPPPGMSDLHLGGGSFPAFHAYVERGWAAFGFVSILFPKWVYSVIALALLALGVLAVAAWSHNRAAVKRHGWELTVLVLVVLGVFFGTELANFTPEDPVAPQFGRYLFPAAGAIAALAAMATFGAGRRQAPALAAGLVTALLVLFWASEFLTMSALYS